jgi:hypothetical protein
MSLFVLALLLPGRKRQGGAADQPKAEPIRVGS